MANATIGSLFVNLGINTAQFSKGLNSAQSRLGTFSSAFKSFAVGLIGTLSVGALTTAFKSVIDKADELGKTAQKIGLPTEELSKLKFAADLADVSLEQLSVGVGILSKGLASIAGGGTGEKVGPALAAIGVAATDANGALRPTVDIIGDVAEAFSKMEDGAGKTALAMAIFGRSGKELIPLLNAGRAGLAEAADEAQRFGIVIDDKTAKAAERFNDNLTRLGAATQGLVTQFVTQLLPSLVRLTDAFVEFVKNGDIAPFFDGLNRTIATTIKEFNALIGIIKTLSGFWKALNADTPGFINDPEATLKPFNDALNQIHQNFGGIKADATSVDKLLGSIGTKTVETAPLRAAPIIPTVDPAQVAATKQALRDIEQAQEDLAASGKRVFEETRTPIENYQLELRELNDLLQQGAINQDTYNRAVAQLKTNFAEVSKAADTLGQELGSTIGSKIEDIFGSAIEGTLNLKDALRDLVNQLAKVAFSNVFQSLLSGGSPAQGGIGSIFGKLFGFAQGGSFKVGGSGGIDSQLVAFKASPNERVTVTKPGQGLGGVTLTVNINADGASDAGLSRVANEVRLLKDRLPNIIKSTVTKERTRSPGFV